MEWLSSCFTITATIRSPSVLSGRALNQAKAAEQEYLAAIHEPPDLPGIHLALGKGYAASQWDKAEDEFRTEANLRPGDAEAAFRFGSALLQNGKLREARQELEMPIVCARKCPRHFMLWASQHLSKATAQKPNAHGHSY